MKTKIMDTAKSDMGPLMESEPLMLKQHKISKWYCKISNLLRICVLLGLCVFIVLAIIFNDVTIKQSQLFLQWMTDHIIVGSLVFMFIYIICTILLIPGSLLTLGAGFVYDDILGTLIGVSTATLIVWISASIGATISFWNGRYLFRSCATSYATKYKYFDIIEQIVKDYGFAVTFWLRMSSITPYNFFNILMGITSVRTIDYTFAHIGMIPDVAVYCFIGASISDLLQIAETGIEDNLPFLIILAVTLVASVIGIILISYYARKKFKNMVNKLNKENTDSEIVSEMQIMSSKEKYTAMDLHLITGFIRNVGNMFFVPMDIVHVLLLFWANGDIFDKRWTNKKLIIDGSSQKIKCVGGDFDTSSIDKRQRDIQTAFGMQEVSRGLKYTWRVKLNIKKQNRVYVGITDSEHIKQIYENEDFGIPYITKSDYFFSNKYRGYALCPRSGDVYHGNAKYGKPYIKGPDHCQTILSIELDLTGKFYGTLRIKLYKKGKRVNSAKYFNDQIYAYDDILVHRKYHLAVAMEPGSSLILLDYTTWNTKYSTHN